MSRAARRRVAAGAQVAASIDRQLAPVRCMLPSARAFGSAFVICRAWLARGRSSVGTPRTPARLRTRARCHQQSTQSDESRRNLSSVGGRASGDRAQRRPCRVPRPGRGRPSATANPLPARVRPSRTTATSRRHLAGRQAVAASLRSCPRVRRRTTTPRIGRTRRLGVGPARRRSLRPTTTTRAPSAAIAEK
jgi:hypothetical protein